MSEFKETMAPLLRPHQVEEMRDEERRLTETLQAPPHISNQVQDRPAMVRQLRRLRQQLQTQAPTEYPETEKDAAVQREAALREQFTAGMPTQAEMRRNPSGAVDKNRAWSQRNKDAILEWKNIRLRLHAGGDLPNTLADARDIANIEMFRPHAASHELTMRGEQIPGKEWYMPTGAIPIRNVMSNADRAERGLPADEGQPPTDTID